MVLIARGYQKKRGPGRLAPAWEESRLLYHVVPKAGFWVMLCYKWPRTQLHCICRITSWSWNAVSECVRLDVLSIGPTFWAKLEVGTPDGTHQWQVLSIAVFCWGPCFTSLDWWRTFWCLRARWEEDPLNGPIHPLLNHALDRNRNQIQLMKKTQIYPDFRSLSILVSEFQISTGSSDHDE